MHAIYGLIWNILPPLFSLPSLPCLHQHSLSNSHPPLLLLIYVNKCIKTTYGVKSILMNNEFIIFKDLFITFMCISAYLHVCISAMCVHGITRGQRGYQIWHMLVIKWQGKKIMGLRPTWATQCVLDQPRMDGETF